MLHNCLKQLQGCSMFVSGIRKYFWSVRSNIRDLPCLFHWFMKHSRFSKIDSGFSKLHLNCLKLFKNLVDATSGMLDVCFRALRNIQDFPKIVSGLYETFQNFWRLFLGHSKHFKTVLSCFIIVRSNIKDARCLFQGIT